MKSIGGIKKGGIKGKGEIKIGENDGRQEGKNESNKDGRERH